MYYWDATCVYGIVGCFADGKNMECRFCGSEPYQGIPCPLAPMGRAPAVAVMAVEQPTALRSRNGKQSVVPQYAPAASALAPQYAPSASAEGNIATANPSEDDLLASSSITVVPVLFVIKFCVLLLHAHI